MKQSINKYGGDKNKYGGDKSNLKTNMGGIKTNMYLLSLLIEYLLYNNNI